MTIEGKGEGEVSKSIPILTDLKCKYCGMPKTGAYYTLSDGKSYAWHNDCLPNHTHEFI
jgi:hypothetical protein